MVTQRQSLLQIPCIVGPTGAGKTSAALALAEKFSCSVINADSRQIYTDFPIITAQPSPDEQAVCPHLLYGFLSTDQKMTAGAYARMAEQKVSEVRNSSRVPLLVGGTGLYFKAFLDGIATIPDVPAAVAAYWIERCTVEGSQALYEQLQTIDPVYAEKIHPNDKQRITRALEVWQTTGKPFSWWHAKAMPIVRHKAIKIGIGLTLTELEPVLARRIDAMLAAGAVEEARKAFRECDNAKAPGWSGIGCQELYQYLTGTLSLDECCALWLKNTRAYAKRQLTWFRADKEITWFAPDDIKGIMAFVSKQLGKKMRQSESVL